MLKEMVSCGKYVKIHKKKDKTSVFCNLLLIFAVATITTRYCTAVCKKAANQR